MQTLVEERRTAASHPLGASRDLRVCEFQIAAPIKYGDGWEWQQRLVAARKAGDIPDQLLLVEHPRVITLGRNAKAENILLSRERLADLGVEVWETNRGGDVTYHGPGQVVGYPVLDLREWKRDVGKYVRALEQVMIDALAEFGIAAGRVTGCTGVWINGAKIGAIGVHLSRWVTSHGWALNVAPDMNCFRYIVPCGLTKPVVSMETILGQAPPMSEVYLALARSFGQVFGRKMVDGGGRTRGSAPTRSIGAAG